MAEFTGRYSVVSRVLVVEDDPETQQWYRDALDRANMTAEIAKDGGQAHAMFTMHKPDFVIMDLMLPGESGFEVCDRFKRTEKTMPVMVVSGVSLEDSRALAARVGADEYLVKPVEEPTLIETIHEVGERVWREHHLDEKPQATGSIRFACSQCGSRIKVKASFAGRPMPCPECGNFITVPRPA